MATKQEIQVIKTVQSMLNDVEPVSKTELITKCEEMGWKPATVNFALAQLKKQGCVTQTIEGDEKMFQLEKEFIANSFNKNKAPKNGYQARKTHYQGEIPELSESQQELKDLILGNRNKLMDKTITWIDENGIVYPLVIAGMGDVTLRCRLFFSGFMTSEKQTGALIYIPWHEPSIVNQIKEQIDAFIGIKVEHECFDFSQVVSEE